MVRLLFSLFVIISFLASSCNSTINREALIKRHTVIQIEIDPLNPLSVGNGEFAFTADITGMQSFPEYYLTGTSLGTFSQWAWHSFPNTEGYTLNDVVKNYEVGSDSVPYWYQFSPNDGDKLFGATDYLRENPHRLHLGLIGLEMFDSNNKRVTIESISKPHQQLDMWTGELKSTFEVDGILVTVNTLCHQTMDIVSFKIESELIKQGRLNVSVRFPYPARGKFNSGYDFYFDEKHSTNIVSETSNNVLFERILDDYRYFANVQWKGKADVAANNNHLFSVKPSSQSSSFELSCCYSVDNKEDLFPAYEHTVMNNINSWKAFWNSGAAIDFSKSTDPRAKELERRVILSQYLTKIQCSGSLPAQETGLTTNSWYGKFHLEMHWWHAVHFILWNRPHLIEQQLNYYFDVFDKAKEIAMIQGYEGVRWQKMTDPQGNESPSSIGVFLIWQQAHIIYFTELLYQNTGDVGVLEKYYPLIEATADFMASYARRDSINNRYVLGPALIPAQERFAPETTINPVFELAYWNWGLKTAQKQRTILGLEPNKKWQHVIDNLSGLPQKDGLYLFTEDAVDSYTNPHYLTDHPIVLAIAGFLPLCAYVNREIMENTFNKLENVWEWETCWGWDFPLTAMCATVLDKPDKAIDYLLMDTPKNTYLLNGHNYQHVDLPLYLPGNGGLLSALAMMCTHEYSNGKNVFDSMPGWKVKYEGFGKTLSAVDFD
jgi:hypothetical protein